MNNKLLIAIFVTAFSGMALATETPDYTSNFPVDAQQFCMERNTEKCQELAALFVAAQELINEHGVYNLTEEQQQKRDELHQAIIQEMEQIEETVSIKEVLEIIVQEEAKEFITDELKNSQE